MQNYNHRKSYYNIKSIRKIINPKFTKNNNHKD